MVEPNEPRIDSAASHAAKRGGWIALAVFVIAFGLATLRPSSPPPWPRLVGVSLAFGAFYAALVYFEIGPIDASA